MDTTHLSTFPADTIERPSRVVNVRTTPTTTEPSLNEAAEGQRPPDARRMPAGCPPKQRVMWGILGASEQ